MEARADNSLEAIVGGVTEERALRFSGEGTSEEEREYINKRINDYAKLEANLVMNHKALFATNNHHQWLAKSTDGHVYAKLFCKTTFENVPDAPLKLTNTFTVYSSDDELVSTHSSFESACAFILKKWW